MKAPLVCRIKPYIQPFERTLAVAELSAIARSEPVYYRLKLASPFCSRLRPQ